MDQLVSHPLVANNIFKVRYVISHKASVYTKYPLFKARCTDDIHPGYTCRVQAGMLDYLANYPGIPWHFKACDDTLINLDHLLVMLRNLNALYDPFTDLVFRSQAYLEKSVLVFPHGGAGWIWSRAWCQFQSDPYYDLTWLAEHKARYRQDDTAIQIILRHMYSDPRVWDEYNFVGFVLDIGPGMEPLANHQWDKLPACNLSEDHGRVNRIISLHTISNAWHSVPLQYAMFNAPDEVYFHRVMDKGRVHICYSRAPIPIIEYVVETLKKHSNKTQLNQLNLPLFDRDSLPDDNSPERHWL